MAQQDSNDLGIARRAVLTTLVAVLIVGLAILLWKIFTLFLLAFGAILIAIFLRALAAAFTHWTGMSDGWALATVILGLTVLAIGGIYLGGQAITSQMMKLADQVPQSFEELREDVSRYEWGKWLIDSAPESADEVPLSQGDLTSYASTALTSLSGGLAAALILIFLAIYLAVDPKTYLRGAIRLLPRDRRDRVEEVLSEVHETLQWWLLGKIGSMFLVGILTSVGLWLIGVPLALALGVVAALLTFVPNFGPIISAVPAVLLAFVDAPVTALYVVILYLAIQTVESYLITPLIQQKTVSLAPALTISTQIAMGILFGASGVILATPITAAALVLINRLYIDDVLEARKS